ncbi:MAG: 30S ribosomal protein S3 [Candidatus Moranbacteria bacterium]|jgi:small subunit ribosomal protein S3|nr:30S ribosomal protein S3 [Candidatus Moranbacteria bacterium]
MGQKVDPRGLRMGINKTWKSRWFSDKNYKENLRQDILIRQDLEKQFKKAAVSSVEIERSVAKMKIIIYTNRPGVLIGRGGQGLEDVKTALKKKYLFKSKIDLQIDVKEVKSMEEDAQLLADDMAFQIEKRIAFRRVMKTTIGRAMRSRNVLGCKVELSGRLGGAEMSRTEWLSEGNLPLHTIRADIDFAKAIAYTTYGTIGVKVWLHRRRLIKNKQ